MKITTYGTAGSLPVCRNDRMIHWGNTTSIRIESPCIPKETVLAVDSGSGFYQLGKDVLKEGGKNRIVILYTHHHHDHTQGLLLSPQTYIPSYHLELVGPVERNIGPKEVFETLMEPPFHPISSAEVRNRFEFATIDHPAGTIILFHPLGGRKQISLAEFQVYESSGHLMPFWEELFSIGECLVIRMCRTTHPEQTVSYRFEERPTGKVFVFLTDHENTDGIPGSLLRHIQGADLLIADAQYDRITYDTRTAGFWHGTGDYVARLTEAAWVKLAWLTHHDPGSSDEHIGSILEEARSACKNPSIQFFSCRDLEVIDL